LKKFVAENYTSTKVSVTMLNNFFECPWKWYFRSFLNLPEPKTTSLALGSAVHNTIEFILKNKGLPSDAEIKEKIRIEFRKEMPGSASELKKLETDAVTAVTNWVENYYPKLSKDYISERSLQFRDPKFPELLMCGKIDLTERTSSGEIIITDFKTGTSKTKGSIEKLDEENRLSSYMRQLAMYSYVIRGVEKGKSVLESRLLFLEALKEDKNALYGTHVGQEQIDLLLRDIKDYDEFLRSGEWVKRPCCKKSYGHDSECEYCKIAEMFKNKN
jgi:RecB family exonuclease